MVFQKGVQYYNSIRYILSQLFSAKAPTHKNDTQCWNTECHLYFGICLKICY